MQLEIASSPLTCDGCLDISNCQMHLDCSQEQNLARIQLELELAQQFLGIRHPPRPSEFGAWLLLSSAD